MLSGDINSNLLILPTLVGHLHGNNNSVSCGQSKNISDQYNETRLT